VDVERAPSRLRSLPSWLLGQAAAEARRVVSDVLTEQGAHRSQFALLAVLDEFGPLSQTALSERSGLDRSDVVRWVDELAADKLVRRSQDPDDRRRNVVTITAAGRRRLDTLHVHLSRAQRDLLSPLSDEERAQLVALLGRILGLRAPEGHGSPSRDG
jgi:MarR family transcriptional regulator, lower aerobic nicotinate degradation pathway regulator